MRIWSIRSRYFDDSYLKLRRSEHWKNTAFLAVIFGNEEKRESADLWYFFWSFIRRPIAIFRKSSHDGWTQIK